MLKIVTDNPILFGYNYIQFYFINVAKKKVNVKAIAVKQIVENADYYSKMQRLTLKINKVENDYKIVIIQESCLHE